MFRNVINTYYSLDAKKEIVVCHDNGDQVRNHGPVILRSGEELQSAAVVISGDQGKLKMVHFNC